MIPLIAVVELLALCVPAAPAGAEKPDIIVILADDLGYAEVGAFGGRDVPTPAIDSLAADGLRFTQGYVSCPVCSPTRAGLMTGRYQNRFGHEFNPGPQTMADERFGLPRSEATLAERLKAAGYATGMVGKWHLGYRPELTPPQRGFDEFLGFLAGARTYFKGDGGARLLRGQEPVEERDVGGDVFYTTDVFGREAAAFIQRHRDEPFFLYLSFNAVHGPLEAPEKYLQRFASISDPRRRTFAAMLSAMDDNIGRVLETLEKNGLSERTLVFFLSDNGGPTGQTTSSNRPLRGAKGQMWEGGIRVPYIVRWKGTLPAGRVCDFPVSALDIFPTALAAAGVAADPQRPLDGVNLLPFLTGREKGRPHETLYWRQGERHAVRHGDWKLVTEPGQAVDALFNLAEDIGEKNDLASREPATVAELRRLYEAWDAGMARPMWSPRARPASRTARASASAPAAAIRTMEQFRRADRNGDGRLSPAEVGRERLFRRLDLDSDGAVTSQEVRQAAQGSGRRRG